MSAAVAPADVEHRFGFLNPDPLRLAVGAEGLEGCQPAIRAAKLIHFLLPLEAAARPANLLVFWSQNLRPANSLPLFIAISQRLKAPGSGEAAGTPG